MKNNHEENREPFGCPRLAIAFARHSGATVYQSDGSEANVQRSMIQTRMTVT